MKLVIAVSSLAVAAVIFSLALIGGRNPRPSRWASDGMLANVYVPLIISLAMIGVSYLIHVVWNLGAQFPALWEIALSAVILLAAGFAIKALKIGSRLARFAEEEKAKTAGAQVIQFEPPEPIRPVTPPKDAGRAAA